jgi:hypothetical protein
MKFNILKKLFVALTTVALLTSIMTGCKNSKSKDNISDNNSINSSVGTANSSVRTNEDYADVTATELVVCFGDDGKPFTMHLYDNDTAREIARDVGTTSWRLPIYRYDDYENWEVMQYYDIPSRYDIPSNSETITSEKAGEVYYSEPNRIILFYKDAQVAGEYTKVGYFDYTNDLLSAVINNPVIEGWGNKIVLIKSGN